MKTDEDMAICPLVEPEVVPGRDGVGRDVVGVGGVDSVVAVEKEES